MVLLLELGREDLSRVFLGKLQQRAWEAKASNRDRSVAESNPVGFKRCSERLDPPDPWCRSEASK